MTAKRVSATTQQAKITPSLQGAIDNAIRESATPADEGE